MAKELGRLGVPTIPTDPTSPYEGQVWYNATTDQLKFKSASPYNTSFFEGLRFNDYSTGRWYQTQIGASTTASIVVSRAYAVAFSLPRMSTLSGICLELATAFTTTAGTLRVGIYDDSGGRMPNARVLEPTSQAATVGIKTFAVSQVLSVGTYWLVAVVQGASGTAGTWRTVTGIHDYLGDGSATPTASFMNGNMNSYFNDTGFTGVLPATFGTVGGVASGPRFAIRFSS